MVEELRLDKKDKHLLYQLDFNSRQTQSEIGRKIRLSQEAVNKRIKKLEERRIITNYQVIVDLNRLGLIQFKILLKLEHYNKEFKKVFIEFLDNHPNVVWFVDCEGSWDMIISCEVESLQELDKVKQEIYSKSDKYTAESAVAIAVEASTYSRSYFLDEKSKEFRESPIITDSREIELKDDELKILKALVKKGRASVVELARELNTTPRIVAYKIRDFEKRGIITGYKIAINYDKLGYEFYKSFIYLENANRARLRTFKQYCNQHPNIIHWVKVIGDWELEPEFEVKTAQEFYRIINEIKEKFSDIIKTVDTVMITKEYKFTYFPG